MNVFNVSVYFFSAFHCNIHVDNFLDKTPETGGKEGQHNTKPMHCADIFVYFSSCRAIIYISQKTSVETREQCSKI